MQDLIAIDSKKMMPRSVLIGAVVVAILFCWFAVRWQFGSMLANLTTPDSPAALSVADLAINLAPSDPVAKWLRASLEMDETAPDHIDSSVKWFEETVRLAPYDYRWRIELGRAYEQADMAESAELEFKRAVELAPTYAFPRWHLGNFHLRQQREEEAFSELRRAAENNQTYREQVFSLAWDYFDKDPAKVEQLAADTPDARASLALFFAARGRATESLEIWNLLSEADKAANFQIAKAIAHGLFIQRSFPQALEFARQIGLDGDARPDAVTNAGFERSVGAQDDSRFGWQINRNDARLEIATDGSTRHEGSRSLKVSFRTYLKPELYNIFQTVAVKPGSNYRLSFWVRTENLKSSGAPLLEIVNANDDKLINASKDFPLGTNDWEEYKIDFRTSENCSGITIRTARRSCGDQCPITGTFWYDDFAFGSSKQ